MFTDTHQETHTRPRAKPDVWSADQELLATACRRFFQRGGKVPEYIAVIRQIELELEDDRDILKPKPAKPIPTPKSQSDAARKAAKKARDEGAKARSVYFTRIGGLYIGSVSVGSLSSLSDKSYYEGRVFALLNEQCREQPASAKVHQCVGASVLAGILRKAKK